MLQSGIQQSATGKGHLKGDLLGRLGDVWGSRRVISTWRGEAFLWEGADPVGPLGDAELAADRPEGFEADAHLCRRDGQRHAEVLQAQGWGVRVGVWGLGVGVWGMGVGGWVFSVEGLGLRVRC